MGNKSNLFKKTLNTRYFGRKSSFYDEKRPKIMIPSPLMPETYEGFKEGEIIRMDRFLGSRVTGFREINNEN